MRAVLDFLAARLRPGRTRIVDRAWDMTVVLACATSLSYVLGLGWTATVTSVTVGMLVTDLLALVVVAANDRLASLVAPLPDEGTS